MKQDKISIIVQIEIRFVSVSAKMSLKTPKLPFFGAILFICSAADHCEKISDCINCTDDSDCVFVLGKNRSYLCIPHSELLGSESISVYANPHRCRQIRAGKSRLTKLIY